LEVIRADKLTKPRRLPALSKRRLPSVSLGLQFLFVCRVLRVPFSLLADDEALKDAFRPNFLTHISCLPQLFAATFKLLKIFKVMDYILNTYVFQYLPFHVSDPTRKYVIDKAISIVQVSRINYIEMKSI
jgi:hypothetical protein